MITQNDGTAKPVGVIQGDASDIKYDENTTVEEAIDDKVGAWTLAGTLTSSDSVTIPLGTKEVCFVILNNSFDTTFGSYVFPSVSLPSVIYLIVADGTVTINRASVTFTTSTSNKSINIYYR